MMKPTNHLLSFRQLAVAFLTVGTMAALAQSAPARKPNILLIVADDLGYGELSIQGNPQIPTPHIDSLGKSGVRFTSGYVSGPYCSPTRAGLQTGRYQQRFGHEFNPGPAEAAVTNFGLSLDEKTIGDRLRAAGYVNGWFGKSHLGYLPQYHPLKRGYDEYFGFLGGAHDYFDAAGDSHNPILRGTNRVDTLSYTTEEFGNEAIKFIDKHKVEPWFVYLPFNAVHAPLEVPEKYTASFTGIEDKKRKTFAGMLTALDQAVGKVLTKIHDLGQDENTLVIFISDNGGPTASTTSGNGPLRGFKAQTWEGGIRVPYIVRWKGHLPAGKVDDRPVIQLDILPTVLAAVGVEAKPEWKLDGVNLLPYLTGKKSGVPHEELLWRFGGQIAIRKGDWKLVKAPGIGANPENWGGSKGATDGAELYNLAQDIGEKTNLAALYPEKVSELAADWNKWNAELVDPKWRPNRQPARNQTAATTKAGAPTGNLSGQWSAKIESPTGVHNVLFTFQVAGSKLTGTASSETSGQRRERELTEGAFTNSVVTFVTYHEADTGDILRIEYTGHLEGNEIPFVAQVGNVTTLNFVARRAGPDSPGEATTPAVYGPWHNGDALSPEAAPLIANRPLIVSADIEPAGTKGVIVAQGALGNGYALYLKDGKVAFAVRSKRQLTTVVASEPLGSGQHRVQAKLAADGSITISVDGKPGVSGQAPGLIGAQPGRGLSVGLSQQAIGDFPIPSIFPGKIANARVQTL